jgi:phosphotransferase system  glucose/maltose/N-acetylglucosamine-specific IIC component
MSESTIHAAVVTKYVLLLVEMCILIVGLVFLVIGFGTLVDLPDFTLGDAFSISKSNMPLGIVIALVAAILMFITMRFLKIEYEVSQSDVPAEQKIPAEQKLAKGYYKHIIADREKRDPFPNGPPPGGLVEG